MGKIEKTIEKDVTRSSISFIENNVFKTNPFFKFSTNSSYDFSLLLMQYDSSQGVFYNKNVTRILRTFLNQKISTTANNDKTFDEIDAAIKQETNIPGKHIFVNKLDVDNDDVIDYVDFDKSEDFEELKIYFSGEYEKKKNAKIKLSYVDSNPASCLDSSKPEPGNLRIWKKNGSEERDHFNCINSGGDFVKSKEEFLWTDLVDDVNAEEVTLYIEGIKESSAIADQKIEIEIDPDGKSGFIIKDFLNLTVIDIILEPITIETVSKDVVYNPCGIVRGKTAHYKVDILPNNFPDTEVKWEIKEGDVSFVGNNKQKIIEVKGNSAGDFKLEIDIKAMNTKPYIKGEVVAEKIVDLFVYFVCKDDGTDQARTEADFAIMLADVNKIYNQVGVKFNAKYGIINKSIWLDGRTLLIRNDIRNHITRTSSNVNIYCEIYCIDRLNSTGVNHPNGIILSKMANERTLAHELGHACGLDDIYDNYRMYAITNELVREKWNQNDWNCQKNKSGRSPGFYKKELRQKDSIQRLLMYGYRSDKKIDISFDSIYGLNTSSSKNDSISTETGLKNMNREPKHN